ncbi:hypothetical protein GCM10010195_50450 [Kitasatospora griseola]|nr:hypothetical protein GCM10010195_50450 [Kitasatospora griseola]
MRHDPRAAPAPRAPRPVFTGEPGPGPRTAGAGNTATSRGRQHQGKEHDTGKASGGEFVRARPARRLGLVADVRDPGLDEPEPPIRARSDGRGPVVTDHAPRHRHIGRHRRPERRSYG